MGGANGPPDSVFLARRIARQFDCRFSACRRRWRRKQPPVATWAVPDPTCRTSQSGGNFLHFALLDYENSTKTQLKTKTSKNARGRQSRPARLTAIDLRD